MLSVLYGPFQPDLETAFVARLRALAQAPGGKPVLIVAPSRRLADRLERLAAVEAGLSLVGFSFHTFRSLALSIVDEKGLGGFSLIGDPVFHDRVVDELLTQGGFFTVSAAGSRPRALAGALRASVRDLVDAGISAEDLAEHFDESLVADDAERKRLSALLALAAAYERRLRKLKILSPSGLTRLAVERCMESAVLGEARAVLYYGFYDITGLQLEFFEAVAGRCETALFFPYRRGHPAFRFADAFFEEKLVARAVPTPASMGSGPVLRPALDALFSPDAAPADIPAEALQVISASGARDELWACAKEIAALASSGTFAYEDIAVVARTLEPYRAAAAEVFCENAIPFDLRAGEPLLRHPLAKACLNLLSVRRRDFPAGAVEDLLGSPYFRNGRRKWRALIDERGIRGGFLQWRGKLEARAAKDPDAAALWELVVSWRDELGKPLASWSDGARRWEVLLVKHLEPAKPSPRESEAWGLVLDALRSLALFDRLGGAPRVEDFLDCLEDKLKRAGGETGSSKRGVRILDAMDARGDSFDVVFLIGLKEKLFPRQVQEDPLLRDSTRAALRAGAGYWIARKLSGCDEERLLFYLAAASARRRLYAVYPRSDEAGKAEVPSLYLRELCRCAGRAFGEGERRVARQPVDRLRGIGFEFLSPREVSLRLSLEGGDAAGALQAMTGDAALLADGLRALPRLNARGGPGPCDGVIGAPQTFLAAWRAKGISPTALDRFSECAFRFFAEKLLSFGSEPDPMESGDFAGWARGKIYHEILERFYGALSAGGDWKIKLEETVESVFTENDWKALGLYPVLWRAAKDAMAENLRAFAAWDLARLKESGLKPLWRERELSGELPGSGGLRIHGVLDRLDAGQEGAFRVVDYKTRWRVELRSNSPAKLEREIAKGGFHQLPLYAELARQALGAGARFDGASLLAIEESPELSGYPRAHHYDADQAANGAAAFWEGVRGIVEKIAAGRFPIAPDDGEFGHCSRCEFPALCRKGHGPTRRRALSVR